MKKIITSFILSAMTLGLSEASLAQGCLTDYNPEFCELAAPYGPYDTEGIMGWYLSNPVEIDTSFMGAYVFYAEERPASNPSPPLLYDDGVPYTKAELDAFIEDIRLMIYGNPTPQRMAEIHDVIAFAAMEVDTAYHFADVIALAYEADHPLLPAEYIPDLAPGINFINGGTEPENISFLVPDA
ncbi:MAG: hypothetical protein R2827_08725 [Bdellovibrionales bacterium]